MFNFIRTTKTIHETKDSWGIIRVRETKHERYLVFDNSSRQSSVLRHNFRVSTLSYQHIMQLVAFFNLSKKSILFLGLGAGCMPNFFNNLFPQSYTTIVELRKKVLNVAVNYFQFKPTFRTKVIIADGAEWIKRNKAKYDIIMLDAYGKEGMPSSIHDLEFYQNCYRSLNARGRLVINYWESTLAQDRRKMLQLQKLFNFNQLNSLAPGCTNNIYYLFKDFDPKKNLKPSSVDFRKKWSKIYLVPFEHYLKELYLRNNIDWYSRAG